MNEHPLLLLVRTSIGLEYGVYTMDHVLYLVGDQAAVECRELLVEVSRKEVGALVRAALLADVV